jgi:hypothetical protein
MAMKIQPSIRKKIFVFVLVAMIFALAVPTGAVLADENDTSPIRLIVINQSQFEFTLWLYGPDKYEITVSPKSEDTYILDRGWYAFTMFSCNASVVGTMDFTTPQTIHVPPCGGTAGPTGDSNQHIDTSDYIRPIRIKIRNRTEYPLDVYLRTVDDHHFLSFEPWEIQELILYDRDSKYVYSFVACGGLQSGYYKPTTIPLDLKCGK